MATQTSRTHSVKFTYEDYLLFPEDGRRHELIGGDRYVTPSPNMKHQAILANLHRILGPFVHERRLGKLLFAPFDILFSDLDVVQPDMLFVSAPRASIITDKNVRGAPDLVIEVLSDSTRKTDEIIKRKLYERFGVQEYWLLDPDLETIKVYQNTEKGHIRAAELSREAGDALTSPLLPGLSISLDAVFAA
ncbi:MAG: Uma2 family endonuclease [Nitrospirota bacterium]|jgi:Uma2 family endonuclease